jgi:hypothetical protein
VFALWRSVWSAAFHGQGACPPWSAIGVSTVVHLSAFGILGLIAMESRNVSIAPSIAESAWCEPSADHGGTLSDQIQLDDQLSDDPGGSSPGSVSLFIASEPKSPTPVVDQHFSPSLAASAPFDYQDLGSAVRSVTGGTGTQNTTGIGNGIGNGIGDGSGTDGSFFGVNTPGKKFVFVVDASSSMNHPFPGPGKTALGRVKLELLSCVAQMSEDQQFFIVYFNDHAIPMPARELAVATPEAKQNYLTWMAKQKGEGQTEPEEALLLALRLQPDVIYFLTDGAFKYRVVKRVADMNRQRVAIHTVCFGNADGEKFMRMVSSQNGGTYQFVGFDSPEAAGTGQGTAAASEPAPPADAERVAAQPDAVAQP